MSSVALTLASQQAAYMAHWDKVRGIVNQRCRGEERRQNAFAWSWQLFLRYFNGSNAAQAAVSAAIYGCKIRRTMGAPTHQGRQDAMDRATSGGVVDTPDNDERQNHRELGWRVDDMPADLQMVARCFMAGLNRKQTAEMIGCSTETLRRRADAIADWIDTRQAIADLRDNVAAIPCIGAVGRFLPYRR